MLMAEDEYKNLKGIQKLGALLSEIGGVFFFNWAEVMLTLGSAKRTVRMEKSKTVS